MVSGASAALASNSGKPLGLNSLKCDKSMIEQAQDRDGAEGQQLGVGRHLGEQAGGADTPQIDEHDRPDRAKRQDRRPSPGRQHGEQVDHHAGKRHRDHRQRRPDRDPVPPGDEKAGEVAIGKAGVGIGSAGQRRQRASLAKVSPRQIAPAPMTIQTRIARLP